MFTVKRVYLSLSKIKNVRKSRFYISKNYANPCENSESILGHSMNIIQNILQKQLCEYLLISYAKSFLNILYTDVEIKTLRFS